MFFSKRSKYGFTLLETVISTGAFAVVLGSLFVVVRIGTNSWLHVQSQRTAQVMMRNIETYLLDDLRRTGRKHIATSNIEVGGSTNKVLWFLSAMGYDNNDSRKEVFTRNTAGQPLWKRNILYFVVPIHEEWHEKRYGYMCTDLAKCPHKLLLRKEIVYPGDDAGKDFKQATLIDRKDIGKFLPDTLPKDLDFTSIMKSDDHYSKSGGSQDDLLKPGCKRIVCLADCIKDFEVNILDGSQTLSGLKDDAGHSLSGSGFDKKAINQYGVDINISAFRADEAARHVSMNEAMEGYNKYDDKGNSYIMKYNIRVVPNNNND